jgi:type 2A phosphatase activator TIP41
MRYLTNFYQLFKVVETDETIDIELLKKKEKIYFFEDVILFEDELADNGCALLNVKMVLPNTHILLHFEQSA